MGVIKKKPVINYPPVTTRKWVPPDQRPKPKPKPKYVKPEGISQRLGLHSRLKKVWHQFRLFGDVGILTANFSQYHKRFSFVTNGRQGNCNCVVACIYSHMYKMDIWNKYHLDTILLYGDIIYQKSARKYKCLKKLDLEHVLNNFYLNNTTKIQLQLNFADKMTKQISSQSEAHFDADWCSILSQFFIKFSSGILTVDGQTYAIWKKDGVYYYFNPGDHDESGNKWLGFKGQGFAVLVRCKTLDKLISCFKCNLTRQKNLEVQITPCYVEKLINVEAVPPCTFEEIECLKFEPPSEIKPHECGKSEEDKDKIECKEKSDEKKNDKAKEDADKNKKETSSKEKLEQTPKKPPALPPDEIKLKQTSFYTNIIKNRADILRASTCQTDPKFSKYNGRQSIANAISALVMLRLYPSNIWIKKTLDTILRYGDIYFHDAMASKPEKQPLLLSHFNTKLYMEPRDFLPEFEEYAAVGILNNQDPSVLDLLPALENLLIDHETCIIFGPIVIAVWKEFGFFYIFDPNERDGDGKLIQQSLKIGSDTVIVDKTKGFACAVRFKQLKDLVLHYMNNLDKNRLHDPFHIAKVIVNDFVELPEKWYNFNGSEPNCWILRGSFDQSDLRFEEEYRNFQGPAVSLIANAFQKVLHVNKWTTDTVDEIVAYGHELYKTSVQHLKEKNLFKDNKLLISELLHLFPFRKYLMVFKIDECYMNGFVSAKNENDTLNLKRALQKFFNDNDCAVVTTHNLSVAVWKTDEIYYSFDSHTRDGKGYACDYGRACVIRSRKLDPIRDIIEGNLEPGANDIFNIHRVQVELLEKTQETVKPSLENYTKIDPYIAILRSNFSECSEKYELNSCKQTVPVCVTALAFNKIYTSKLWSMYDMDEILERGNDLYVKSVVQCKQDPQCVKNTPIMEKPKPKPKKDEPSKKQELTDKKKETSDTKKDEKIDTKTENDKKDDKNTNKTEDAKKEDKDTAKKEDKKDAKTDAKKGESVETKKEEPIVIPKEPSPLDDLSTGVLLISTDNVKKNFSIGINNFDVEFETYDEGNIHEKLHETLQTFFEQEPTEENKNQEIILESNLLTVAMWRDDYLYYMFDSKPRGENGQVLGKDDWTEYISTPEELEFFDYSEEEEYSYSSEEEYLGGGDASPTRKNKKFTKREVKKDEKDKEEESEEKKDEKEKDEKVEDKDKEDKNKDEKDKNKDEKKDKDKKEDIIPIKRTLSYWAEQEKLYGRSCVMWFTRLDDLIGHVIENMPPVPRREVNYTLKTVKINNTPDIKNKLQPDEEPEDEIAGKWNNFEEIEYGKWIIRGTINLLHELFPKHNRGKQSIPCCSIFLAFAHIFPMNVFKSSTIDKILCYGDKLFSFVKRWKKQKLQSCIGDIATKVNLESFLDNETFGIDDMIKKVCILKSLINFNIEIDTICGDITAPDSEEPAEPVNCLKGLESFFTANNYGLFQAKGDTLAVFKDEKGMFYMFTAEPCAPNGLKTVNGTACLTRFQNLKDLSTILLKNLRKTGSNKFCIHKVTMSLDMCVRKREPNPEETKPVRPIVGGFNETKTGVSVLSGSISNENERFESAIPNDFTAPTAFIALTMPLIHKVNTWAKPIVDEILILGNELYVDSVNELGFDFNPWEEKLDVFKVKNEFKVGVIKVSAEIRHMDQTGLIDTKDPKTQNLRLGIENFFKENSTGILVTEPLTLAIWEEGRESEHPLIYIYDPFPRGTTGMPFKEGAACVVSFVNCKLASDHIINCIVDHSKRQGKFTIIPLEIIIDDKREKRKSKTPQTTDERTKMLRKMAEEARKRKQAKKQYLIGRRGYHELSKDVAILRGLRSQFSEQYSDESRGNQDIPNCIAALVMHQMESIDTWTHKNIDLILDTGDQVYIDSYITYGPQNPKLGMENVLRKFFMDNNKIHVTVYKPVVSTLFTTLTTLNRILCSYFQQEQFCLISYEGQWVSIVMKSGYYYLFDPHDRNINGNPAPNGLGWAMVYRFTDIENVLDKLVKNLDINTHESSNPFRIWLMDVSIKSVV